MTPENSDLTLDHRGRLLPAPGRHRNRGPDRPPPGRFALVFLILVAASILFLIDG